MGAILHWLLGTCLPTSVICEAALSCSQPAEESMLFSHSVAWGLWALSRVKGAEVHPRQDKGGGSKAYELLLRGSASSAPGQVGRALRVPFLS